MNIYYSTKHRLKIIRWRARRAAAARRWGKTYLSNSPAVLGNAMPKSGSHLIIQVLRGLIELGPFVNPGFPPVNRSEDNHRLPDNEALKNIQRMLPGDIAYGYILAQEPFISALTQPGQATVFVYRDPRDMIVSHIFYATQIHAGHGMHHYYTQELNTMEERIDAAIRGVRRPGSELSSVRQRYENYLGWLNQPDVLSLRFEDLILDRSSALGQLMDYLEARGFNSQYPRQKAIEILTGAINPKKSGTFRKAKPGNWREHFNQANIYTFKSETGDLLIRLGYESDEDW